MDNYIIYLLINTSNNCTYVGITNNPELVGGAKYTKMKKGTGKWDYYGFIQNVDKHTALSIEKKIHIYSKRTYGNTPLEKRINCIGNILKNYEDLLFITI